MAFSLVPPGKGSSFISPTLSLSVSHFCASAYAIKPDFNPVVVDIPSNYLNDFRLGGYALQVGKITRY